MSAAAPKLAIEYFDIAGRAELARAALWIGNVPFEDIRLTREQFAENKAAGKYPFGQVPVMWVDGEAMPQSLAMARYAGRLAGLIPEDPVQAFKMDAILDTIDDVLVTHTRTYRTTNEETKKQIIETLKNDMVPRLVKFIADAHAKNGGKFLVGDKLTLADVAALVWVKNTFGTEGVYPYIPTSTVTDNAAFESYISGIKELDVIKSYFEKTQAASRK